MAKARFEEDYTKTIRSALKKELDLSNVMEVPRINKVVLNVGVGREAVSDSKVLNEVVEVLTKISGQKAVKTKARKSIAGFKIREGMPLGVKVTLRGKNMYEFLDRLITTALPAVRDFQGVSLGFDKRGNYNLGIKDWTIFPEIGFDGSKRVYGLNISVDTSAKKDEHAYALLKNFGMPLKKAS